MSWPYIRGERHGKSKFTQEQITSIIDEYIALCQENGKIRGCQKTVQQNNPWMSRQNIGFICQGKLWPHITQPRLKAAGLLNPKYEFADCDPIYQRTSPFWLQMNERARERRLESMNEDQ